MSSTGVRLVPPKGEEQGITLGAAKPVAFIQTKDAARAVAFYRDVLGLRFVNDDGFANVFDMGGALLRITRIPDYVPHAYPALGWHVASMSETVADLKAKGVALEIYPGIGQGEDGIWIAPGGKAKVAWFKDPDGNLLSVTES